MPKFRHRKRQLLQIALFCFPVNPDDAIRLGKWKAAQKQIVNQAEHRCVHSDADRKRQHRQAAKGRSLPKLPQRKSNFL